MLRKFSAFITGHTTQEEFFKAIGEADFSYINQFLNDHKETNAVNQTLNGVTALHVALRSKHKQAFEVIKLLCSIPNIQVDQPDLSGKTPLMVAVSEIDQRSCKDVAQMLLTCGANIKARDLTGKTALHWACSSKYPEYYVKILLQDRNVIVDATDHQGNTPLYVALGLKSDVYRLAYPVKDLLAKGASLTHSNKKGQNAEHIYLDQRGESLIAIVRKQKDEIASLLWMRKQAASEEKRRNMENRIDNIYERIEKFVQHEKNHPSQHTKLVATIHKQIKQLKRFECPISLRLMVEPIAVSSGITYDRPSLEKLFLQSQDFPSARCPVTGMMINENDLKPSHFVKNMILEAIGQIEKSLTDYEAHLAKSSRFVSESTATNLKLFAGSVHEQKQNDPTITHPESSQVQKNSR